MGVEVCFAGGWTRLLASAALAAALVPAVEAVAEAGRAPLGGSHRASSRSAARSKRFVLRPGAIDELRESDSLVVSRFPLGEDGSADLELRRFEPFRSDARVEVMEEGRSRRLRLPDQTYFAGNVLGAPRSRVLLIAGGRGVHGFVGVDGEVYPFGPDGDGSHRSYALRDMDPQASAPPSEFCGNDLVPDLVAAPSRAAARGRRIPRASAALEAVASAGSSGVKQADIAIETDTELRGKFPSSQAALEYLADLAAAVSSIYERDAGVRIRFSYVRLWSGSDPWSATDGGGMLTEVQRYWTDPSNDMGEIAGSRDLVHFVSGKYGGGIAFLGGVCNPSWGFAVSRVWGSFDVSSPGRIWDVLVVSHEIGHNFGSPHTHCYSPPVDKCYAGEGGCYSGPVVPSQGTIMSYCYLSSGGLYNVDLLFGSTVSSRIQGSLPGLSCLAPVSGCGNGVLDGNESCDDGNTTSGDCCSATCQIEPAGSACGDDGNACTDDACDGSGICRHASNAVACDDGDACTSQDTCSQGSCRGTPFAECGPCLTCAPDGSCIVPEALSCEHSAPDRSQLFLRSQEGRGSLRWSWVAREPAVAGVFGDPSLNTDLTLCLYDGSEADSTLRLALTVPAGSACGEQSCWKKTSRGYRYRDAARTAGGVQTIVLTQEQSGKTKLSVIGGGPSLPLPGQALGLPVRVRLERSDAPTCWETTFLEARTSTQGGTLRADQPPR